MKDFMLVFRGNQQTEQDFAKKSPQEMQAELAKWGVWMEQLAKSGHMISGEPLKPDGKVLRGTKKKLTDGPFIESKEIIGGFLVIKAKDFDQATELAKGCPALESDDGTVEIREIMKFQ